jgi:two-component system, OmpR family, response regulator MtrA
LTQSTAHLHSAENGLNEEPQLGGGDCGAPAECASPQPSAPGSAQRLDGQTEPSPGAVDERTATGGGKARILVAEDDPDVRGLVRHILEADGYDVTIAADGELAVEMFMQMSPDLLVLDLMMPKLSGFEVLDVLRSKDAIDGVPVLILSARASETDIVAGFEHGICDYVVKPFMIAELRARVRSLLARKLQQG